MLWAPVANLMQSVGGMLWSSLSQRYSWHCIAFCPGQAVAAASPAKLAAAVTVRASQESGLLQDDTVRPPVEKRCHLGARCAVPRHAMGRGEPGEEYAAAGGTGPREPKIKPAGFSDSRDSKMHTQADIDRETGTSAQD